MPSVARELPLDQTLHSNAELIEHRRNVLRYARLFPPGPQRNLHRQVALSLRALFKNKKWLDAHTVEGLGDGGW
jgi:hypothetical protein